jgi:hypothetical protein
MQGKKYISEGYQNIHLFIALQQPKSHANDEPWYYTSV